MRLFFVSLLIPAAVAVSLAINALAVPREAPGPEQVVEGPGRSEFDKTGEYRASFAGVEVIALARRITPGDVTVVYALSTASGEMPVKVEPVLVDDAGHVYALTSHAILGEHEGVLAGVLVSEPYRAGGKLLSFRLDRVQLDGGVIEGPWEIPILTTAGPPTPLSFIEFGRLVPRAGVTTNGAVVGVAGPAGAPPIEVLVVRGKSAASLRGTVDSPGLARPISAEEFARINHGYTSWTRDPDFPWPEIED